MNPHLKKLAVLVPALFFIALIFGMPRIASAADRYWVGNSGVWDGSDTSHWAASSGGASGASVPTSADNCVFDSASFTVGGQSVNISTDTANCLNVTWTTSSAPTLTISSQLDIYRSLTFATGMLASGPGFILLRAPSVAGIQTITSNGVAINTGIIIFDGGAYQLSDNLTVDDTLYLSTGTFDANDFDITLSNFSSSTSNVRTLNMGTGTWTLNAVGSQWDISTSTNMTLNPEASTLTFNATDASQKDFYGGALSYQNVHFNGRNILIHDSNVYNGTFAVNNAGLADALFVMNGSVQTIMAGFTTNGSAGNLAVIRAFTPGTPFYLTKSSGTVSVDYVDITDSTATGGATWYAGANSSDGGGNTGWIFAAAPATLYFNNAVDDSWDTAGNWWTDASFTTPAGGIPATGDTAYIGATLTTGPSVPVTLAHIYVADPTTGGGTFYVVLNGTTGDATFYDGSYQGSVVSSVVTGNAEFHDTSSNQYGGGYVTGNATFYEDSYNSYSVAGNAVFNDTSNNAGFVSLNATFNDSSQNNGAVYGNAFFYDTTTHTYSVSGDAFFDCSATNSGTVSGTITYGVTCPTIVSGVVASNNSYIDVTVSENIWGADDATTVMTAGKFSSTFVQNAGTATATTISSITKTSGGALDGSETVIRVHLLVTGTASGVETIAIKPLNATSIYNTAGDPMRPEQTTGALLFNAPPMSGGGGGSGGYILLPSATPTPTPFPLPPQIPSRGDPANLARYGLHEGDVMGARPSGDPDVFIVNQWGYKRLFLNPVIFGFYGHLGGFAAVTSVVPFGRDAFPTSGLFRNCDTRDGKVYALEVTGEDTGTLHWINMTGDQAVFQDPEFFKKDFCINNNEFNWYTLSPVPYTSLSQLPVYRR